MKRTRIRRRKLIARGTVTNKALDDACRAVVFARDGQRCLRCSSVSHLQWSHVFSRRYRSIRWNPLNSMTLCAGCHLWWHARPTEAGLWWVNIFGEVAHATLQIAMKSPGKLDRKLTLLWLQHELKRVGPASMRGATG